MASVCRRLARVAPNLSRSLIRTATNISDSAPVLRTQNRQFGEIHRRFCSAKPLPQKEKVTIHFMTGDGDKQSVQAKVGENLLDVIIENDVDIDGFGSTEDSNGHYVRPIMLGACEGTLACSTCHLIFKPADFEKLPETPSDEELDMLDLAYGLTDTSRLGCQVIVSKDMEGWEVCIPEGVADAREP